MSREKVLEMVRTALHQVNAEIDRHQRGQGTVGTPEQLGQCRRTLEAMEKRVDSGSLPPKAERHSGMGRMVVDSWPLGSALGGLILEAEQAYMRL